MPAIAVAFVIFPRKTCRQLRHDVSATELPPTSSSSIRKRVAANFVTKFPQESCRQLRHDLPSEKAFLGIGHQILTMLSSVAPLAILGRWRGFPSKFLRYQLSAFSGGGSPRTITKVLASDSQFSRNAAFPVSAKWWLPGFSPRLGAWADQLSFSNRGMVL